MNIGGLNIPAELTARGATGQQGHAVQLLTPKNRQAAISPAPDQYRSVTDTIIEAEYVDLYSPIHRPPEQQNQWRHLIVEGQNTPPAQTAEPAADNRQQQLIARYGQNRSDLPLPGSFVNLLA